jgi:2-amino-4-hydroxy-6-hydroxymethyldihydropteridine diphosphokinase
MGTPAWIGLGSNLGDRKGHLDLAVAALSSTPGVTLCALSGYRETAPVGGPGGQPAFLNAAAAVETTLAPEELLQVLNDLEARSGRVRDLRWEARTLDLDLLLYGESRVATPRLNIPHPRMALRRFVLAPLAEIAPMALDPVTGHSIAGLLANLDRRPSYVAIATEPRWDWHIQVESHPAGPGQPVVLPKGERPPSSDDAAQLCERLEQALPAVAIEGRISASDRLRAAELCEFGGAGVLGRNDGESLLDLATGWLDVASCAALVAGDGWLVSHFWFDALFLSLDSLKSLRPRFPGFVRLFLEARRRVYPPTFVVARTADLPRLGLHDPRYAWRRPIGWDTPVVAVDDLASEAAFAEVVTTCAATRTG